MNFRSPLALLALTCCALAARAASHADTEHSPVIENSVVKVFSTMRQPDPFKPWTKQAPSDATASGVVIEGKRILTNAHAVLYASQVQVQANAAGDKVSATVLAVAPGIDLAVLKLEDESFFASHPPLARANKLPNIKDAVLAYGFPTGGSSLSITKGIVSRIEFVTYNFPTSGLRIQIDAAINPGNSGGPAVAGDKMIGLAFSRAGGDTQNIGYIIPNEEVELFLKDIADGHYDGKPAMFDELQTLENPALRAFLKVDKSLTGMVVHNPDREDADYPLKEWDIITHIGDMPIDNQGMINLDKDLRVAFPYQIQHVAKDGKVPLTVLRAGKTLKVALPVSAQRPSLARDLMGDYPPYFIYGPIAFSVATRQMVAHIDANAALMRLLKYQKSPLVTMATDFPTQDLEELVVISSPFFPHKLVNGYSSQIGEVVYSVNGKPVKSLKHMVEILRDLSDPFVTFEFNQKGGEALVFERQEIMAATDDILTDNGVRAQASPALQSIWQEKQSGR
jgi:S1-C subfamily serine protease